MSTLVTEVGTLPEKARRRSSPQQRRRKSGLVELAKSPIQRVSESRQPIGGPIQGDRQVQDGRLPVIVEGKHFPRKTLDSSEISRLLEDETQASESPELGSPPVAHFEVAEPINFVPAVAQAGSKPDVNDGDMVQNEDVKVLPATLERRKRRRASALLEDMPNLPMSAPKSSTTTKQDMPLKTGAKRKLDVRDDANKEEARTSELDDFAFQTKTIVSDTVLPCPRGSRFTKSGTAPSSTSSAPQESTSKWEPTARRVLAPKSTNSPTKTRRPSVSDKIASLKDDVAKQAKPRVNLERASLKATTKEVSADTGCLSISYHGLQQEPDKTGELPPRTPAELNLFSPISTEPSVRSEQLPEMALGASVEDVLGGTDGRGSRRARGAVSYAEPSLRAKMRRPTKEFVPAVGEQTNGFKAQQQDPATRGNSQERQGSIDLGTQKVRTLNIKTDQHDDESIWTTLPGGKEEPASPLVDKTAKSSSAPSPPTPKPKAEASSLDARTEPLETGLDKLSIFDGPASSSQDLPNTITVQSRKISKRPSSTPAGLRRVGQEFDKSTFPPNGTAAAAARTGAAVATDRPPRPSSAASVRSGNEKADLKRSASVSTLRSSTAGAVGIGVVAAAAETVVGRTERAAARRRSMMT